MSRLAKILVLPAACAVAMATAACGTQRIKVPQAKAQLHQGAVLFSQRCAGCHTLSYAATNGSAPNIRTAQANSGPNFDQRCERPIDRILYAIVNGGFSGAYMPQNVVVGQDAVDVAKFVATYSGRQEPAQIGITKCQSKSIGTVPSGFLSPTATTAAAASASSASTKVTSSATKKVADVTRRRAGAKKSAHS
jgi:mono/diheme cytochrome c family protein